MIKDKYLFMGITMDKFSDNPSDNISNVDFYNSHSREAFGHFGTSYEDNEKFIFKKYAHNVSFDEWRISTNLIIPLTKEKFEVMKSINTSNHKSLKKFLKSFGFQEYLI